MTNSTAKMPIMIDLSPIGGGGNPLRAWVLAWFDIVKSCLDWVLSCFIIFRCHPELVSEFCDVKKMEDNL